LNNTIKVIDWLDYRSSDAGDAGDAEYAGAIGRYYPGFFEQGMRWKDYQKRVFDTEMGHVEALRSEIVDKQIRITGMDHHEKYIPLFNDETIACLSVCSWGDLMAAIWSEEEDKDYSYRDF